LAKNQKIAVLMGGRSGERDVSLSTGQRIAEALASIGYSVASIDAAGNFWEKLTREKPDAVFIALHGRWGEDGTVQGVLELLGLPYTGSGVLASALAMDKLMTKKILLQHGIPTPKYIYLNKGKEKIDFEEKELGFPVVVKPVHEGSALGINIAKNASELANFVDEAFGIDDHVLIESYIPGKEVTVGILENESITALPTLEIISENEFYNYEAKYSPGKSRHIIPAGIPGEIEEKVKKLAVEAHKALGCRDFSRIDFMISEKLEPFVLEVNTIPGMTPTSLYPEAAAAIGVPFNELIDKIIKLALKRSARI
jgi:D-alanine-D-alanine ligase